MNTLGAQRTSRESNSGLPELQTGAFPLGHSSVGGSWWQRRDSNPRRRAYEARAWPPRAAAPPGGLEPPDPAFVRRRAEGIEPLGLSTTTPVFKTGCPPLSGALRGRPRNRTPLQGFGVLADPESLPSSWTARESNPPRVACKASLHPSAQPWRRASRGRLTRRAHVRPSSGRQESNLRLPGSRPGGQPLTHAQMSRANSSGVTGGDRTLTFAFTARRAEPLHHGHHVVPEPGFEPGSPRSERSVHAAWTIPE